MKSRRNKSAMTLAEVLLATVILTVGIGGSLLFMTQAMRSSELASDLTLATAHGEYVLEEMYSRHSLFDLTTTDWPAWVAKEGLASLPNESIKVKISSELINPVDVKVSVSWTRRQKPYDISFDAKITQ